MRRARHNKIFTHIKSKCLAGGYTSAMIIMVITILNIFKILIRKIS